jgi:ATP-dependent DNA helicase PIF1
MRLLRNQASMTPEEKEKAEQFASWLLRVGEGLTDGDEEGLLCMPEECCIPPDSEDCLDNFVNAIYPDLQALDADENVRCKYFERRAILAPRNACVDDLNQRIIEQCPEEETVFLSADTALDETGHTVENIPDEYLNGITISGFPLHNTVIKVGIPIILLRNLDPSIGLCNGTRLLITRLRHRVIEGNSIIVCILSFTYAFALIL